MALYQIISYYGRLTGEVRGDIGVEGGLPCQPVHHGHQQQDVTRNSLPCHREGVREAQQSLCIIHRAVKCKTGQDKPTPVKTRQLGHIISVWYGMIEHDTHLKVVGSLIEGIYPVPDGWEGSAEAGVSDALFNAVLTERPV